MVIFIKSNPHRNHLGSTHVVCVCTHVQGGGRLSFVDTQPHLYILEQGDLDVQVSIHLSVRPSVNIYTGCLVSATPLTVLYQSFWNFACVFFMVWGCACGLDIIVRLFFVIFHPQCIDSGYLLWAQLLRQFCTDHFETLHMFSSWYEDVHVVWI